MRPYHYGILFLFIFTLSGCGTKNVETIRGEDLAVMKGCMACHAVDESVKIGPSWVGLFGSQVILDDGTTVTADEAYLKESIIEPNAKIAQGYSPYSMPVVDLTPSEVQTLIEYIRSVQ
jgi:cytochrome c oxidase subunit 2